MRAALAFLLILPLSGCIHVAPRPISPVATAAAFENRSLSDARMQEFVTARVRTATTPIGQWDLQTLTLAAFYFHPDLDVARAQAAVARAAIITAAQRPNPTLTLPIEHKALPSPWVIVPGLDVPIETAGKRGFRVRGATARSRAADLAIAQRAWQVRDAIRTELVALTTADDAVTILRREAGVQTDLLEALEKRLQVGETSILEVTRARIAANQTALLLRDRETAAARARARLAAAIGVPESGIAGAKLAFNVSEVPTAPNTSELRQRALIARPDVLMSLADYAAAEADLRLELARQYPDLHIAPGFGWDEGRQRWDLGLSFEIPVLSRNRGPIAEAEARRAASEAQFVALQAKIIAAVDESSGAYRNALAKLGDADRVVASEEQQAAFVQQSFNVGQTDRVALRTTQLELETARLAQVDSVAEAQQALGALEDAVEQPLTGGAVPQVPAVNPRENGE